MANMVISWTDASGNAVTVIADASVHEIHDSPADVSDHPLETGAIVSDHINKRPDTLQLEFHISNTPIKDLGSMQRGAVGQKSPIQLPPQTVPQLQRGAVAGTTPSPSSVTQTTQNVSVTVLQFTADFDRVTDVRAALISTQTDGILVSVLTTLTAYDNMAIINVSVPRDAENGDSSMFTVDMKRVRFATSQTTAAPVPQQPRGRARSNSGSQTPAAAPTTPRASFAYNALLGD